MKKVTLVIFSTIITLSYGCKDKEQITPRCKFDLFMQINPEFKVYSDSCFASMDSAKKYRTNTDSFIKYIRRAEYFKGRIIQIDRIQTKYLNP